MNNGDPTALEQYQEYYSIQQSIPINVLPLPPEQPLPDWDAFLQEIPEVFRLATDFQSSEHAMTSALRHLGDFAELVMQLLQAQNSKLNLLLGYILRNEDQADTRQSTKAFGGGGVRYLMAEETAAEKKLHIGQYVQLKVFLPAFSHSAAAALYTYAEVAHIETTPEGEEITLAFSHIRDEDREVIVRASLHAQSQLLKKRAKEREK